MIAPAAASSMRLSTLLAGVSPVPEALDVEIDELAVDSRDVTDGTCFIALDGERNHGLDFAPEAVSKGAKVVLSERRARPAPANLPVIVVPALRTHLANLAARFYGQPGDDVAVWAVTGTKGKTSVAFMTAQALTLLGQPCAYVGTLGTGRPGALHESRHTTPDIVTLNRLLAGFRDSGLRHASIEASSHALHQGRLDGLTVAVAAFTNLGHDHLDYHGDQESYGAAKRRLFETEGLARAIINVDDVFGARIAATLADTVASVTCSSRGAPGAKVTAREVSTSLTGVRFELGFDGETETVRSSVVGRFAVDNLLLVAGLLFAAGYPVEAIGDCLSRLEGVPGRMQRLTGMGHDIQVFVDYAHTPESLEAASQTLRELTAKRLLVVFGCGGDRDRSKRAPMARAAAKWADRVTVTSDNPRHEDPAAICAEIAAGFDPHDSYTLILDRRAAIVEAIANAEAGDAVLIAGKGHETVQIAGDERLPFSDAEVASLALRERAA